MPPFMEELISKGIISERDLKKARKIREKNGGELYRILIDIGALDYYRGGKK